MADESKTRRSALQVAWGFLPRVELVSVLANYGTDFTDKFSGDVAAGIVVAGEQGDAAGVQLTVPQLLGFRPASSPCVFGWQ